MTTRGQTSFYETSHHGGTLTLAGFISKVSFNAKKPLFLELERKTCGDFTMEYLPRKTISKSRSPDNKQKTMREKESSVQCEEFIAKTHTPTYTQAEVIHPPERRYKTDKQQY